jgi:uncharacterized repeat protein (TIGR02543 family)
MRRKKLVCFALSLLMLLCMFAVNTEKAYAIDSASAVLDKIMAGDAAADDRFGSSVVISGDLVAVGAVNDDSLAGAVYVYDLSSGDGTLSDVLASERKLTASDRAAGDKFGLSVAMSGNTIAVGAFQDESSRGSVYIYDLSSGEGSLSDVLASELKLTANDRAANDFFGYSVAISGDHVAVGAYQDDVNADNSGSVYIYDLSEEDVSASQLKLTASDGALFDNFGYSVAISGDTVVVGAVNHNYTGAVYVYDLSEADVSASQLKLTASDGAPYDYFGCSVAILGDTVAVGAYGDGSSRGSVYIYDMSEADVPGSQLKLTASDGAAGVNFGNSVAISGDTVAVGAYQDHNKGAAYVYDLSEADVPASELKLAAGDGAEGDYFGCSVAISGDQVAVGASGDGSSSGSVYTYIGKYDVVLDKQGGSGGDDSFYTTYNGTVPPASAPSRAGYDFDGYYSRINGGGTKYYTADMTIVHPDWYSGEGPLYANWIAHNYTVAFDGNGADSGSMPDQSFTYDIVQSLTASAFSKTNYFFLGWATSADGEVLYSDGQIANIVTEADGDTVTLYAKWNGDLFTVSLNQQGGTGGTYSVTAEYESAMPPAAAPTRQSYTFQGYFTAVNGGGEQYYNADMSSAKDWDLTSDTVLYAYWTESSPLNITTTDLPAGTLGESYSGTVTASGGDGSNSWYANGLPGGLSIERDTGAISGRPNETGTFSVKVTVYDAESRKAEQTYSLVVSAPSGTGRYEIAPDTDSAYTVSTVDGLTTLTINSGYSGFRFIEVSVAANIAHEGTEVVIFTQKRDGVQIGYSFNKADYDSTGYAGAGFNVQEGDIIKIFIVDELSNSPGSNPLLLQ